MHGNGACGRGNDLEGGQHSVKLILATPTVDQQPSHLSVPGTTEYHEWKRAHADMLQLSMVRSIERNCRTKGWRHEKVEGWTIRP